MNKTMMGYIGSEEKRQIDVDLENLDRDRCREDMSTDMDNRGNGDNGDMNRTFDNWNSGKSEAKGKGISLIKVKKMNMNKTRGPSNEHGD